MNIPVRFGPGGCPPLSWPPPCPPAAPAPVGSGVVLFSSAPPVNPAPGNFWWDGTTLHLFDGVSWVNLAPSGTGGGAAVGTTPPQNPAVGALWWNGTIFQVFDGTQWKPTASGAVGVTDGSNAAPGFIGEFLNFSGSVPYNAGSAGSVATTNVSLQTLTIPPGDWNIWAFAEANLYVTNVELSVVPFPVGMSNNLLCFNSVEASSGNPGVSCQIVSPLARGSFTVATLITLAIQVQTMTAAGTIPVGVHARRVR